jgi:hypothetical protein
VASSAEGETRRGNDGEGDAPPAGKLLRHPEARDPHMRSRRPKDPGAALFQPQRVGSESLAVEPDVPAAWVFPPLASVLTAFRLPVADGQRRGSCSKPARSPPLLLRRGKKECPGKTEGRWPTSQAPADSSIDLGRHQLLRGEGAPEAPMRRTDPVGLSGLPGTPPAHPPPS